VKPSVQQMASLNSIAHKVLPTWNYTIAPTC
jgi:hypothetical protein